MPQWQGRWKGALGWARTPFFVVIALVFLVTGSLRLAFNAEGLYTYGFDKYRIAEATDIPDPELRRIAGEIIAYFNNDALWLDVRVNGSPLYNEREVLHMRDVKALVQKVFLIHTVTGVLLLGYLAGGFALDRRSFWPRVLRQVRLAGIVTLGTLAAAGLALAVAFPWLFYLFHVLSFRNPFWQLDPRTDYLVRMFPEGFWFDATMFVALATAAQALALTLAAWWMLRVLRKRGQGAEGPRDGR